MYSNLRFIANNIIKKEVDMKKIYSLRELKTINLIINKPSIVFLRWDLWAGKTTFTKHILWNILEITDEISSPTYTYYNKYWDNYHFDLYRLKNYDEFFSIGWEEILDNNEWVILIEWPDIIGKYYKPDIEIFFNKTEKEGEREIEIIKK